MVKPAAVFRLLSHTTDHHPPRFIDLCAPLDPHIFTLSYILPGEDVVSLSPRLNCIVRRHHRLFFVRHAHPPPLTKRPREHPDKNDDIYTHMRTQRHRTPNPGSIASTRCARSSGSAPRRRATAASSCPPASPARARSSTRRRSTRAASR